MPSLQIFAGHHARAHIENNGLHPKDIKVIIGASGGPKWFVLSNLDRYLVSHWMPKINHDIQLIGSSVGAWRMSAYASDSALSSLDHLEHEYLNMRYSDKPNASEVSASIHNLLDTFVNPDNVNNDSHKKLHIVSARTKGLTAIEQKFIQTAAFATVAAGNLITRRSLPFWFDRVVFQSNNALLPVDVWDKFKTTKVLLDRSNYRDALVSTGAIPVIINGVKDPKGAPKGMYRDGGMVDYHFDLPIKPKDGLVLYPHFAPMLKPGWFDKPLPWRRVQVDNYSHTVVICPSKKFVDSLPFGKIPDRKDFERLSNDERIKYWNIVVDRNKVLAEAFDQWSHSNNQISRVEPIENLILN